MRQILSNLRGQDMEIYIEPAKRAGKRKLIRRSSLQPTEVHRDANGVRISVEAEGIYDSSRYLYTIKLTPENLALIFEAWNGS
ncbi:hypothetical protein CF98_23955 [Halopseudomonas bauzanensis]|nr:hypothetical protein CF98_23955 [Halopseudomonas bauzanensis]